MENSLTFSFIIKNLQNYVAMNVITSTLTKKKKKIEKMIKLIQILLYKTNIVKFVVLF